MRATDVIAPLKTCLLRWGAATALLVSGNVAFAADVVVFGANAVREPFEVVAHAYERASGNRVVATWSGTAGIVKRVTDGETVDIVLIGSDAIDRLVGSGHLARAGTVDFARSGVGVAVRPGIAKPDISTPDALRAAILGARSVAYSSGPSGLYIAQMLERLGIANEVKGRLVIPPPSVQIGQLLARGEVELGFQQISDLLPISGIQYVGPLPPALQSITIYRAALGAKAPQTDAAKALLALLTGAEARTAVTKAGMEPGQAGR